LRRPAREAEVPRRSAISLADVTGLDTLAAAFWRAARPHRDRGEVRRWSADLDGQLARLRADVLAGRSPDGEWTAFSILDPKPRQILAPCFRDRVLHHALMAHVGPGLERALVDDTFACRAGKGTLAAVRRAQAHVRRFAWFVNDAPDRYLLEELRVCGMVRYMDDVVWWCDDRAAARATLAAVRSYAVRARSVTVKADTRIGRSAHGVPFLGFRVLPSALRLSLRRRRRYAAARARWERRYAVGEIGGGALQAGYDAALAITAHASAQGWRRAQLRRRPVAEAIDG
jgi:hypothetical protein